MSSKPRAIDIVGSKAYRLHWRLDEDRLLERGMAMLESASGDVLPSEWASVITIDRAVLRGRHANEEIARIAISPFKIDGNSMAYEWSGTVAAQVPYPDLEYRR